MAREGEDGWRRRPCGSNDLLIYSDSQSPSLNDSRPGATGCWREVLSCVVVSARSQRLLSRRLSLSSSCCRNCGICDGGGAISPQRGFQPAEMSMGDCANAAGSTLSTPIYLYSTFKAHLVGDNADAEWLFHGHWFLTLVNHSLKKISFVKFSSHSCALVKISSLLKITMRVSIIIQLVKGII